MRDAAAAYEVQPAAAPAILPPPCRTFFAGFSGATADIPGFLGSLRAAPGPAPRRAVRIHPHNPGLACHERLAGARA